MIGRVQLPDSGSPLLAAAPHHYLDIATRVPWQYTGVAGEVTNCRSG
ncbi:hypothetical protein ABT288_43625 [Streptomyces sp. NPDC001093]